MMYKKTIISSFCLSVLVNAVLSQMMMHYPIDMGNYIDHRQDMAGDLFEMAAYGRFMPNQMLGNQMLGNPLFSNPVAGYRGSSGSRSSAVPSNNVQFSSPQQASNNVPSQNNKRRI